MRPVVDLLVEQVECADFVLLNKTDLLPGGLGGEALEQLTAIISSLNPLATVIACEQAKVCSCCVWCGRVVWHVASSRACVGAEPCARAGNVPDDVHVPSLAATLTHDTAPATRHDASPGAAGAGVWQRRAHGGGAAQH
jgi:hypothetical protein